MANKRTVKSRSGRLTLQVSTAPHVPVDPAKLQAARMAAGWTLAELAQGAGVRVSDLARWEQSAFAVPLDAIRAVATMCRVTPDDLTADNFTIRGA